MPRSITLLTVPLPVQSPEGLIYSTSPRVGTTTDGEEYFLKGPAAEVVAAEVLGYSLAEMVGLETPQWSFTSDGHGSVLFASRGAMLRSDVGAVLASADALENPDFLARCAVLDLWIANPDRNLGNVVAELVRRPRNAAPLFKAQAIDFEKARVLLGEGRISLNTENPRAFLPKGDLAPLLRGKPKPEGAIRRIMEVAVGDLEALMDHLTLEYHGCGALRAAGVAYHLHQRAAHLPAIIAEAWP